MGYRFIKHIILHCTAGPQSQTLESIKHHWHKVLGWKTGGYHKIILPDGKIENLYPLSVVTNGVKGFNSDAVHLSYVGGVDSKGRAVDNRTPEQKESLLQAIKEVYEELSVYQDVGGILIRGHRDFSPDRNGNGMVDPWERLKECPCFEVLDEYGWIQGTEAINRGRIVFK